MAADRSTPTAPTTDADADAPGAQPPHRGTFVRHTRRTGPVGRVSALVSAEIRRLTSTPLAILALLALICVPVIYGGLYLWANQDPQHSTGTIPAALVIEDTGTVQDGAPRNIGQDVGDELVENAAFQWDRVDAAAARAGVDRGTYAFAITLPADFSTALTSAGGTNPEQALIGLTVNDANNAIASTMGATAAKAVQDAVAHQVGDQAASKLLTGLADVREGMVTAADGAGQLETGANTAVQGAGQLATGAHQAADGAWQLADGTSQLADGAARLDSGLSTLEEQTASLPEKSAELATGAQSVADADKAISDAANEVGTHSADAVAALPKIREEIKTTLEEKGDLSDEEINAILADLDPVGDKLRTANDKVQEKVTKLNELAVGSQQVANGAAELRDKSPELFAGIQQAHSGASQVATGASTAADGAAQLRDGTAQLATGMDDLSSGLTQLDQGADKLHTGLVDGVVKIPDSDQQLRDKQASVISDPVSVDRAGIANAQNYGAGLAPFFATLSAWIGIYALFLIVKPFSKRAVTAMPNPAITTFAGWAVPALFGLVQMSILYTVLRYAIGFEFENPWAVFGILALASGTFAAIIMALNVWLGSVGQFLGLVLMVLQLVSAGGTFPWQTLPEPIRTLHAFLPMTWSVESLRRAMLGGTFDPASEGMAKLAILLVVALIASYVGITRMTSSRTMRDLRPSLIG